MIAGELLVIAGVILAVFNPKKLPMLAQHAALIIRRWTHFQHEMRVFMQKTLLEQQLKENVEQAMLADAKYMHEDSKNDNGV